MFKLNKIKPNPRNPRKINPDKFEELKNNIQALPKMLRYRPIVYDPKTKHIVAGNMRYRALLALDYKEVDESWVVSSDDMSPEELRRFIILDNTEYGAYDYEMLKADYTLDELEEYGVDTEPIKYALDLTGLFEEGEQEVSEYKTLSLRFTVEQHTEIMEVFKTLKGDRAEYLYNLIMTANEKSGNRKADG